MNSYPPAHERSFQKTVARFLSRLRDRQNWSANLRDPRLRLRVQAGLAFALAVGIFVYALLFTNILSSFEARFTDLLYQPVAPSGQVAIIAIDKTSLDDLGPWPWPRALHAALLDRLSSSPPRVIAFDVLLSQPAPDDPSLASAIKRSGNVILSAVPVEAAAFPLQNGLFPQFDVLVQPSPDLRDAASAIGHRLITPDPDDIVRRVPLAIDSNNVRYPALGLAAAQLYRGDKDVQYDLANHRVTVGNVEIPVDDNGRALLNFTGASNGIQVYSYSQVFRGDVPVSKFAGKLVFIGGLTTTEPETFATPLRRGENRVYSVNIEADLADMLISAPPHLLQAQGQLGQLGMILAVALLAGLTLPHTRPLYATALTLIYLVVLLLVAFEAFNRGLIVRLIYPAMALILTFGLVATFRYLSEERRRQFLTTLFRRYLPAESVGRVVEAIDRGELPLSGTRRNVTVLYADLRGFSILSEGLAPEAVLELVNRYLELMLRAIQAQGGTVNKPMGDTLVAIWNAPLNQEDHAPRAIRAAVEIRRNILKFQKNRAEEQSLNFGIGLATGFAVLGNISALGKTEYTLVGETVNVAARISAFAGNNQILADTSTAQAAPEDVEVRELSPVRVRGRKEPLPVWEIRDPVEIKTDEDVYEE